MSARALYETAMKESHDLLQKIRGMSDDPARQIASKVLENRRNIAYITTIYEATQEMESSVKQKAS